MKKTRNCLKRFFECICHCRLDPQSPNKTCKSLLGDWGLKGFFFLLFLLTGINVYSEEIHSEGEKSELNVRELILDHVSDGYDWHITSLGHKPISIPLPVIVKSKESGWHVFLSSKFHHGHEAYRGFSIAK
jgi:hypothetical protein